jgi:hypothetical protein
MKIEVIRPQRKEMLKNIARFSDLKGCNTGLPDMYLDEGHRTFYNVLGFEPPSIEGANSPFGAASQAYIKGMKPGFGLAFVGAKPGCGTVMHSHDTNETFMVVSGAWRMEWEDAEGVGSEVLRPMDVCSFPVGIQRKFVCEEAPPGQSEGLLLALIAGDAPNAEYSPEATKRMIDAGVLSKDAAEQS